jgi:hypothetical protein
LSRILIIGCGRSGTRYASKVLRQCGLEIGHEKEGKDGMSSWMAIGNSEKLQAYDCIYHQVREPLGVISSFHTVMKRTWRKIYDTESRIVSGETLLLRCMKYWLYWNQLCEEKAKMTYQVEKMFDIALPKMLADLEIEATGEMLASADKVSNTDHTRTKGHKVSDIYKKVTWDDLEIEDAEICMMVRDQAIRYGYDV